MRPLLTGGVALPGRVPVLAALGVVISVAWAYLLWMAWGMANMDAGAAMLLMPRMSGWGAADVALVALMWTVMMVAMMLPTALPMVLAYRAAQQRRNAASAARHVTAFVAGYLAVWTGFSVTVTLLQWALLESGAVSPMMALRDPRAAGALLIAAGLYQASPLKRACLASCQSPLMFLMTCWRPGVGGAWRMGLQHGLWCTGCCWLLMALLFVLGVMNLAWIAALTLFVLVEKGWPRARWLGSLSGLLLVGWGVTLVATAV